MFRTLEEQKTTKIEKYPAKNFRVFSKIRLEQIEIKLKQELKYNESLINIVSFRVCFHSAGENNKVCYTRLN